MDIKSTMEATLQKLENLKEKTQNSPVSSEPSETTEAKQRRVDKLVAQVLLVMQRSRIPKKFTRPDYTSGIKVDYNRGACLTGKTGVGKTMAIAIAARDWLIRRAQEAADDDRMTSWSAIETADGLGEPHWRFVSFPAFVMELQDSYRDKRGDDTALDMLKRIASVKFLILDDLGAEKPTDFVRQATYYIINEREMWERPTFITTNFSMDHLNDNIDPRISSRIAGMCDIIRLEGKDRRMGVKP